MNYQQINSDRLERAIRNTIQQEGVVGRALRGSVCSLPMRPTLLKLEMDFPIQINSIIL